MITQNTYTTTIKTTIYQMTKPIYSLSITNEHQFILY